jgi:DNA adenine methylase
MLSNSSTDLIRDLYADYEQVLFEAKRAISSRGDGRGDTEELLVLNRHRRMARVTDEIGSVQ